jgi:DNA-binding NarL/FixJ family response regulator
MGREAVVADDDVLVRAGVVSLLESAGYDVVGQVADGAALMDLVRERAPDVAVIDIRMPPTQTWEGIDVARTIRSEFPHLGILLLSAHVELETALDLLEEGKGFGYLLKSRILEDSDLADALDRVALGGSVIDPGLVQELLARRSRRDPLAALTRREREVLALMAEGRSNAGIAQRLYVSEAAIEKHVRSILAKLGLPESDQDHRRVLAVLAFLGAN